MSSLGFASVASVLLAVTRRAFELLGVLQPETATPSTPHITAIVAHPVVTDLTVCFSPIASPSCPPDLRNWHRIDKDLYLYSSNKSAWLYVERVNEEELVAGDLVVIDITVGERPDDPSSGDLWESRPGGIWMLRSKFSGKINQAVTEVDVVFGMDAVDPRPQRTLIRSSLQINARPEIPVAKLSVLHGRAKPSPDTRPTLRVKGDGTFKIVQISDTHMVTGVGLCKDAIDAKAEYLPESEADPLTVDFIGHVLDVENPNLLIYTGDQVHHGILDSQSALFKAVAPAIERSIPFATVFGNHDSEGIHALSRSAQMSLLQDLPYSLSEAGPEQVAGIGNYYIQVLAPDPSQLPVSTLYFLDSHGEIPRKIFSTDYDAIKQSQIDWFKTASQTQRAELEKDHNKNSFYLPMVFQHIPLPEFKDPGLVIRSGHRGEPTEGPSFNSHFYDALAEEGISALGCGHDHANDFCALLPQKTHNSRKTPGPRPGPWLCHAGGSGFGGYGTYGGKPCQRRMRVWEFNTETKSLTTWMRVRYAVNRVDELVLVQDGAVFDPSREEDESGTRVVG
ncbi:Metallo-dependent phosphatase [Plenodomus tracheiphilus IPT5]|uniref:Metallo-dependent phosphatase n=1 Tax=Plenodomus tracheiphilus IPT5 TaxID=1408161 RepID=A0A6A7AQ07_9PLEO|nr:Metallo-dependent phosphatase [Plenodomus tracheiphilus IPT5]